MRAIVIREPGGPEVLELRDVPDPAVPHGHIGVRVRCAGINRADLLQRAGYYPAPPGVPADIPGLEYAGVVEEIGPGASLFSRGDRVFGLVAGGACAERVVVHEREAARIPEGVTDEQAAAVPEAFLTAYDALVTRGRLAPGDRVLIHAAGSGVGTAGIQIARALGCFVVGTSRSADKLERGRELGMNAGVVPEGGAFAAEVRRAISEAGASAREAKGGAGVDVVLDLIGGSSLRESIAACAVGARVIVVGLVAGTSAEINLGELLQKRVEVIGTVMRSRPLEEKIEVARLLSKRISPWLSAGVLRPIIDRVFPLASAAEAHAYVASNASFGKVLLHVTD
jgi:NADPH2:quinone reductase